VGSGTQAHGVKATSPAIIRVPEDSRPRYDLSSMKVRHFKMAKTLAANYESGVKGARAGKRLAPLRTVPGSQDPENGPESVIKETQRPDDGRHDVGGSKPINFQVRLPWSRRCASCQCPARPKSARHIRRPPSPAPSAASAALSPLHHRRAASPWCVAPRSGFPPNSPAALRRCAPARRCL
jgi:hypothetical protein